MVSHKEQYDADSLTVLEGLDAVRKRPGMYIGTTDSQGLMHCLWEIIDNAVDEALAGACDHIVVTLHDDGSIEVADNGRGIPVDVEPKTKLTGVEVVLTKLHAGAKFGNASYNAAGGLHGVGSSVVNALSLRLDVEVDRDGKTHHMAFHQGHPGVYSDADPEHPSPASPFKRTRKNKPTELEIIGTVSPKTTGTRVRYWADPEIFNSTAHFSYEQLIARVRQTSFLVPGLKITVIDEHVPEGESANIEEIDSPEDNVIEDNAAEDNLLENQSDNSDESVPEFEELESETTLEDEDDSEDETEDETEDAESEESAAQSIVNVESASSMQNKHHPRVVEFLHNGGVKDFVDFLSKGEAVSDIWRISGEDTYVEETQAVDSAGDLHAQQVTRKCGVDIAMRWVNGYDSTIISFVNVVETPGGGMHVDGFLQGLTKQIRKAVEDNARKLKVNLKDSNTKIERDDITAGLVAVVTVRIAEPQFQGQTKDVL
ncbi:DNA topoisomerase IV subunit B, partial [Bifidobacteriaceae bacterium NR021]